MSPALQPRLKCLIHIMKKLTAEHEEFIAALVPEVRGAEGCVCFGASLGRGSYRPVRIRGGEY